MSAPDSEARYASLRRFNLIMGFLHLIQGILMIVLSNATTYPIYTNFLNFDVATRSLAPNPQLIYELRFGPAVALFLLISAVAHFYLATIGYPRYVAALKKGMNPIRFYEYALSSSLMIVLIGMLVGVWDIGAIILIFGVNAMMNLFGIMMELQNQTTEEDRLDSLHLRLHRRDHPVDRDHALLRRGRQLGRRQAAGLRLHHHPDPVHLLQHLRPQHVLAVQEGGSLGRLPVRRAGLHHPQPAGQDRTGLVDLCRHTGAGVNRARIELPCSCSPVIPAFAGMTGEQLQIQGEIE